MIVKNNSMPFVMLALLVMLGCALSGMLSGNIGPFAASGGLDEVVLPQVEIDAARRTLDELEQEKRFLQTDIDNARKLLADFEQEKKNYQLMISADREQAEAIAQLLSERQEKEAKRTFWFSIALGFLTNMITGILCLYLEHKVGIFRRWLARND